MNNKATELKSYPQRSMYVPSQLRFYISSEDDSLGNSVSDLTRYGIESKPRILKTKTLLFDTDSMVGVG